MLQNLGNQLVRDLKASWKKTAMLGLLLLVGLIIWIPMLLGAIGFSEDDSPRAAPAAPVTAPATATTPTQPPTSEAAAPAEPASDEVDWRRFREALDTDPLLRPVDVETIRGESFAIDTDQFPPPILFANADADDEPAESAPETPQPPTDDPRDAPQGLELKSTVVGAKRRAALLNGGLHFEGGSLVVDDVEYHIVSVHQDRVILNDGEGALVLRIREPGQSGNIEIRPAGR